MWAHSTPINQNYTILKVKNSICFYLIKQDSSIEGYHNLIKTYKALIYKGAEEIVFNNIGEL